MRLYNNLQDTDDINYYKKMIPMNNDFLGSIYNLALNSSEAENATEAIYGFDRVT